MSQRIRALQKVIENGEIGLSGLKAENSDFASERSRNQVAIMRACLPNLCQWNEVLTILHLAWDTSPVPFERWLYVFEIINSVVKGNE